MLLLRSVFIFLLSTLVLAEECRDIDPAACKLMSEQRSDLCSDQTIARTACPKFCNLCPIECYHCNSTVQDYHMCTTTISCPKDHMCMKKELKSVADGHHEYEMTCASTQECDDPWNSLSTFGKRNIVSRDVSVTCCAENLCNYPEQTTLPPPTTTTIKTTSGCIIDLVLVVDESNSLIRYESDIQSFLRDIVSSLPVSDTEVRVALGLFNTHTRTVFRLNTYHSKHEVLREISNLDLHGGSGEINAGLDYIKDHALTLANGDRPSARNVAIIITDDGTTNSLQLTSLEHEVHRMAQVISVEIGNVHFSNLASDTRHQFRLNSAQDLHNIVHQVSNLIC